MVDTYRMGIIVKLTQQRLSALTRGSRGWDWVSPELKMNIFESPGVLDNEDAHFFSESRKVRTNAVVRLLPLAVELTDEVTRAK